MVEGARAGPSKTWIAVLAAGLVLIGLAAASSIHFSVSAAIHKFPKAALAANRNWIFIGLHAAAGFIGLLISGLASSRLRQRRVLHKELTMKTAPAAANTATVEGESASEAEASANSSRPAAE